MKKRKIWPENLAQFGVHRDRLASLHVVPLKMGKDTQVVNIKVLPTLTRTIYRIVI
jgi:hypothetical protein